MKTIKYLKGLTIVIIVGIIILSLGFKKSSNSDLPVDDSPLYGLSLKSSVAQLERKIAQFDSSTVYSVSGKIDSINTGNCLKGIVVVLTKVGTTTKQNSPLATTAYSCYATCSYTCGATCQSTCAGKSTCVGSSTCSSTCLYTCAATCQSTCAGKTTCVGSATCIGSSTCSSTCLYTCAATCQSTCVGKTTCVGSATCFGSSTCSSTCYYTCAVTCSGSTYCGSTCPTVNGTTCEGTTYCGNKCPTINQVTCYNTCNTATCETATFVKYDTTDVNGNYTFDGLTPGDYIVTPIDTIYKCVPENRTVSIIDNNVTEINFSTISVISSVKNPGQVHVDLIKIYPNPFSNSVTIGYDLYEAASVVINIYDNSGKVVKNYNSKRLIAGSYNYKCELLNCESGIYIVELIAGKTKLTKKVVCKK